VLVCQECSDVKVEIKVLEAPPVDLTYNAPQVLLPSMKLLVNLKSMIRCLKTLSLPFSFCESPLFFSFKGGGVGCSIVFLPSSTISLCAC